MSGGYVMNKVVALLAIMLAHSPVLAAPGMASEHAVTTRSDTIERSWTRPSAWEERLELDLSARLPSRARELPELHADLRLPSPGPETMRLSLSLHAAWSVYVTADLDAALPRLDAVDSETYFTVGTSVRVTERFSVFVEDFQPAGMVIGSGQEEPAPAFAWDGHQVTLGARLDADRVRLEAAAVIYALSTTNRRSGIGAVGSVTVRF
jgi:hypothetical protein